DMEAAIADAMRESAGPERDPRGEVASGLSPREREVLALLVQGKSNPEIADVLSISRKTVAIHVSNILRRLGVESRSAAVAVALQGNLV
ncbi:MAG: helix-turn-helix transcriptional regulator, partial [Pyrinomonadaceae bacterium]